MFAADEARRGEVVVKDMRRSTQSVVKEDSLLSALSQDTLPVTDSTSGLQL
jgi:hypothetical protein